MDNIDPVKGFCLPEFSAVQTAFAQNFSDGLELGASFCAYQNGDCVIDLWGGDRNNQGQAWEENTLVTVYSLSKIMTVICTLMLADRNELDIDRPVAEIWPEFGAAGKDRITTRQILSHTSGLAGWDKPLQMEDLYDWEYSTGLLAAQAPWWEPGTRSGYHANTQGHLLGEIVRRITGLSIGQFFQRKVAKPYAIDFHIGLEPRHESRLGQMTSRPPTASTAHRPEKKPVWSDPNALAARALLNPPMRGKNAKSRAWREAEIPSGNGFGNARSVAKLSGLVASGKLLSKPMLGQLVEEQIAGIDLVLGAPLRFGLGLALQSERHPIGPNPRTCYWTGWGGSLGVIDSDAGLGFAYVMNRMSPLLTGDKRSKRLWTALYKSLDG